MVQLPCRVKHNGKEINRSHGLNQYDYSARHYDPGYGRFTTMDPHSENYYSISPYAYVMNNPMRFTDPTGKDGWDFLHAFVSGAEQKVGGAINVVVHPIETVVNMATAPAPTTIGEAVVNAADQTSMGSISTMMNAVQAVASDLNGGNGSATGAFLGGMAADLGMAVVTGKAVQALGNGLSAASKGGNTVAESASNIVKPSLLEQAKDLSNKVGKNSVEITTSNVKYHYDLKGASHKGVDTPHIQRSFQNTNPKTGQTFWNKDTKWVQPMTQQDIRIVRKFTGN